MPSVHYRLCGGGLPGCEMGMKLTGVWLAMCLDWVVRATAFVWRYLSGKWLHQKVIDA